MRKQRNILRECEHVRVAVHEQLYLGGGQQVEEAIWCEGRQGMGSGLHRGQSWPWLGQAMVSKLLKWPDVGES